MAVTAVVVYKGVEGGIERVSKFMMPILLVLVVVIAGYSLTLRNTDANGQTRTGLQGLLYYIKPDFTGLTVERFLEILLDAMSRLFFSLSVSMGIMITYGSYVKPQVNLSKSVNQIEVFDTGGAPRTERPEAEREKESGAVSCGKLRHFAPLAQIFDILRPVVRFSPRSFFCLW